jgi:hypothetical protein
MNLFNLLTSLSLNNFCPPKFTLTNTTTNQTLLNKQTNKQGFRAQEVPKSVISGDNNSFVREGEVS